VILNRAFFDRRLAACAVRQGATLLTGARVKAVQEGEVVFSRLGRIERVSARFVVGADGPLSVTATSVGSCNQDFVCGLQVEAPLAAPMPYTEAHFRPEWLGGYGWVFPKQASANVGLGVAPQAARRLPGLLEAFLRELRGRGVLAQGPARRRTGGLIPVGGPPPRTVHGNVVLVGDAAGQTDPVTGSGIPAAVECGETAGGILCEVLRSDSPQRLRDYEDAWRDVLGGPLGRALAHRRTQLSEWSHYPFERLIRRTWIAFPAYYHAH
jgi:flavin-dependent dehydrogenase